MTEPIIVVHRRNKSEQLANLPAGSWVEIDIDLHDGAPVLSHDPVGPNGAELLDTCLLRAVLRGVAGFVFDCKRENVEPLIKPLLATHNITNYFYLNEMEVQADIFLDRDTGHHSAVRIWQYRGAAGIIRYANDMKATRQNYPDWVWIDCWRRGLPTDITKAFVPLNKSEASGLQEAGMKLCICSPELYVHSYDKTYANDDLQTIYRGVVRYRQALQQGGIMGDAVCTKFPKLWTEDLDSMNRASEIKL
jgi:hypothetical protein